MFAGEAGQVASPWEGPGNSSPRHIGAAIRATMPTTKKLGAPFSMFYHILKEDKPCDCA